MTQSPESSPLAFTNLAAAIGVLRKAGLRIPTARRLVLEALFAAAGPVSAADLARGLSLDESSVYRNLEVLEQLGVVRHVHLGHSAGLYALVTEEVVEYLYCERCAKVTTVPPARLDTVREQIRDEVGYSARFTHFPIVGLCPACSQQAGTQPRAQDLADLNLHTPQTTSTHPATNHTAADTRCPCATPRVQTNRSATPVTTHNQPVNRIYP